MRHKNKVSRAILLIPAILLLLAGLPLSSVAQKADTSDKMKVDLQASQVFFSKTDSGEFYRFIGNAVFHQGTDTLYCDSLHENKTTKQIEAFSNVRLAQQGGTQGTSDYLRYQTDKKLAFMQGNVVLTDGKNHLNCNQLTYDLGTKTAVYDDWGVLHNDSTRVTSKTGIYNVKSKEAHFKERVTIEDPQYKIYSEDLMYFTETKVTQFFAQSTVVRDEGKGILQTKDGTYDGKNGIAHFIGHSSIWNDGQYIEADTLQYNKLTGYGLANGNVISIDTEHHSTIYCGHAEYFQKKRVLWATIKPVLEQVNSKDTLYMRADTFYSAPMVRVKVKKPVKAIKATDTGSSAAALKPGAKADTSANVFEYVVPGTAKDSDDHEQKMLNAGIRRDTVWEVPQALTKSKKGKKAGKYKIVSSRDTGIADTTAPLYFIGYHHVLIFSDSLQGRCDSISYMRSDSTIRMMYAPVAWSHNSQITGDTIFMQLDSNQIRRMYVPNNAFIASQSGPPKAKMYDQVQGKTLTAYFRNNEITNMLIFPDAECIYYSKDEKNAYLGMNQGNSVKMRVYFDERKIRNIKFETDVHQTMTPLDKADIPGSRLSRFKWLADERPKSKDELFR